MPISSNYPEIFCFAIDSLIRKLSLIFAHSAQPLFGMRIFVTSSPISSFEPTIPFQLLLYLPFFGATLFGGYFAFCILSHVLRTECKCISLNYTRIWSSAKLAFTNTLDSFVVSNGSFYLGLFGFIFIALKLAFFFDLEVLFHFLRSLYLRGKENVKWSGSVTLTLNSVDYSFFRHVQIFYELQFHPLVSLKSHRL